MSICVGAERTPLKIHILAHTPKKSEIPMTKNTVLVAMTADMNALLASNPDASALTLAAIRLALLLGV